jgi:predicted enzyme related to lactoylglutathione lyase
MTSSIEVAIDAVDAEPIAMFWEAALGYRRLYEREPYIVLGPPPDDGRPRLVIQRVDRLSPEKTPVHIDLRVEDPDAEVARLQTLGATVEWVIDESASGSISWTTMADPQGTVFCVCPARKERYVDDVSS